MKSSSPRYVEVGKLVGWRPWLLLFQEDAEIWQSLWGLGKVRERTQQRLVHQRVSMGTLGQCFKSHWCFLISHSDTHIRARASLWEKAYPVGTRPWVYPRHGKGITDGISIILVGLLSLLYSPPRSLFITFTKY